MFYSFDALNSRSGRFRLIWRAATATQKKLNKRECMEVSVYQTCEELLRCIPSSRPSAVQAKTKYSLYLLAQLLYGTTIIHREQMDFFFLDVRHLWNQMRRPALMPSGVDLPFDKRQGRDVTMPEAVPHGARRSLGAQMHPKTLNDLNFVFDFTSDASGSSIVDFNQLDTGYFAANAAYESAMGKQLSTTLADMSAREEVRSVRPEDITMNEYMPEVSRIGLEEQGEELMPPTEAELDILQNMMMDTRVDDFGFADQQMPIGEPSLVEEQRAMEEIQPMEEQQPIEEQLLEKERESPPSEPPTFELEAVAAEVLEERAERSMLRKARGAKHRTLIDADTFITKEVMQSAIADYSDLVRTKEELKVDPTLNKIPGINRLFDKRPAYIKNLAPPLVDLMNDVMVPRPFERMTARAAWNQPGLLLHREGTPTFQHPEQLQPPDELQPPGQFESFTLFDDHQFLEPEPLPKRRKVSEPQRTPSPAVLNWPTDRTPEVLESERAAGTSRRSFESIEKGRGSSMLPPESAIAIDGEDVFMVPEGILDRISERDTVTDRPPIHVSSEEAVRRYSKEALLPPSRFELSREEFVRQIRDATADKPNKSTTFFELTAENDRAQAAKKFYLVLALLKSKHRKISVNQTDGYGPIQITSLA